MADIEELEKRLRRVEDIEAIRKLRMTYHLLTNEGALGQAGRLFTDEAYVVFEQIGEARGRAAFDSLFERLQGNVDFILQFPTNHMVELDGDTATGVAYLDARYAQQGKSIIAAVKYTDKYCRTAQGWRFTEMVVKIIFAVPIEQGWAAQFQNQPAIP